MSFLDRPDEDFDFDAETFEQVILYICSQVDNVRNLSKTKLHKILYFVDREVYLHKGTPLTGEKYVRNQYGPTSTHLDEALALLEENGKLCHIKRAGESKKLGSYEQNIYIANEEPDVDETFAASEVQLLDELTELISQDFTSEEVSEISHDIVWRAARKREEIPYYTSLLQVTEPEASAEDEEWARRKAQEIQ